MNYRYHNQVLGEDQLVHVARQKSGKFIWFVSDAVLVLRSHGETVELVRPTGD